MVQLVIPVDERSISEQRAYYIEILCRN